jgi:benzoyl-CoA 2,3-dioxygenase component B
MSIDYTQTIPNNVDLASDRRLQRALEAWRPRFLEWWRDQGPDQYQDRDVYLRTAVDVGREGWAHFDYVKMPEYRWGIFLAEPTPDRRIGFGERKGEPAWQEIPGEHRTDLRRLVVVQGDTEPASVEQQRHLAATAPSLYDMRNLFQINVEEARHLWAMVYLLHAHFGRDGRDEADSLLERTSGDSDRPRILGAFNDPTTDWLSFMMFTYFTDRDGKFQLAALRESAFDPLARTCDFMLKEEAHHMFVGATGIGRVVARTVELMTEHDTDDVRPYGGIDVATLQRYLNHHFSLSLDLFGGELSTNAANYFSAGLKGRFHEDEQSDDHVLTDTTYSVEQPDGDAITTTEAPALNALNQALRDAYIEDCSKGLERWNRLLAPVGAELRLPHAGFNRHVGLFAAHHVTPGGRVVSADDFDAERNRWLPTEGDREFVASLMSGVHAPGQMAGWIGPPSSGVHTRPVEFEYVLL